MAKITSEMYGDKLRVASGGIVDFETGAALRIAGVDVQGGLSPNNVAGVAAGKKINFGEGAFDGSNPTPVAHGLTTCVAVIAVLKGSAAPGVGTTTITALINGANVEFYAWKPTSNSNPTLIASTGTEGFYWIACGV